MYFHETVMFFLTAT